MASKTTRPSGLAVSRSGWTYTLSWKQGGSDYKGGQKMEYSINYGAWVNSGIGTDATSFTITDTNQSIYRIDFKVQGKKKNTSKKTTTWSAWVFGTWQAAVPAAPVVEYDNGGVNLGTFKWSCTNDQTSAEVFVRTEVQKCVVLGNSAPADWGTVSYQGASGAETITEDTAQLTTGNLVRWYRVRSYGPAGWSAWSEINHAYGAPYSPILDDASADTYGSSSRIMAAWRLGYELLHPVDLITVQYTIGTPTDTALSAPSSGWRDAIEVNLRAVEDRAVVNVSDVISEDECMWVRVVAEHDSLESYSNERPAQVGQLKAPTIVSAADTSTGVANITITEETQCNVACTAIFYRSEDDPSNDRIVAILPRGTTTAQVTIPDMVGAHTTCFGAYAFVGSYDGTTIYATRMRSGLVVDSNIASVPPAGVTVTEGPEDGTVRIGWEWSWADATEAEITWADSRNAWESTKEPSSYTVENKLAKSWIVAGLEVGKRWYFRVRLVDASGDDDVLGPWSDMLTYDLASVPDKPAITLSKNAVNEGEAITARWAFSSSDGVAQQYAEICLVTFNQAGEPVYGDVIARADAGQSAEIVQSWTAGSMYYLAVRVTAESGIQSDWSEPATVYVTDPCEIDLQISSISFGGRYDYVRETYEDMYEDGEYVISRSSHTEERVNVEGMTSERYGYYLPGLVTTVETTISGNQTTVKRTETQYIFSEEPHIQNLPITATVTGAGSAGTTTVSIIRAEDCHTERPDGKTDDGYAGEVIASKTILGEGEISIGLEDLVGSLDDGAPYYIEGKVVDVYGQSDSFRYPFKVAWTFKTGLPAASIQIDKYQRIAMITPIAPAGAREGYSCDIYRLSADEPELIVKDGQYGTTYVDPYPGFGQMCGHRIVAKNQYGDSSTDTGFAWLDTDEDYGDILLDKRMVIDVDGQQIVLPYNIELSNSWKKDFQRTVYLGGSVQGDWNPAVTRDLSARTVLLRGRDLDQQIAMRDLAGYAGIAHIRTPDGSSLTADIQVRETMDYKSKRVSYSLAVQAIDPEEPDGVTLEEWAETHPIGE